MSDKPKFCICITTFKKNAALRIILESLIKYANWDWLSHVVICDDNYPQAETVFKEYDGLFRGTLVYVGGKRAGVAINKNRGIWYFKVKTQDTDLILLDDDIEFMSSGLEQLIKEANWPHITGFIKDYRDPLTGKGFFEVFPAVAETEDLWFCHGCMGVMLYMTRAVIEKVGYMNVNLKGLYGYEHELYSNRILKKLGYQPKYHAILKWCHHVFKTQKIPNDYVADAKPNEAQYAKLYPEILEGFNLSVHDPRLGKVELHEETGNSRGVKVSA